MMFPSMALSLGPVRDPDTRPSDFASCCRSAVHKAKRPADASTGRESRCPEAGV
jgi:hypothetical protein